MVQGFVGLFLLLAIFPVNAELCQSKHIKDIHHSEIEEMKLRPYWKDMSDLQLSYTARLLACHEKVDSKKVKADGLEDFLFMDRFSNLPKRTVHGRIRFLHIAPLGYGYTLEKKDGQWNAELLMKFHYPLLNKRKTVDIHRDLAVQLGLWKESKVCGSTVYTKSFEDWTKARHRHVKLGRVVHKGRKYSSCRVPRDLKISGRTMLEHHMDFWRRDIEHKWSRPGFKMTVKIVNQGEVGK